MRKPSVTIGIVALNEEDNIEKMFQSLFTQKKETYTLDKILLISDGSTDDTVQIVKSLANPKVVVHEYRLRIGKSQHLNTLFQKSESDIIVLFDADILLANPVVIDNLIKPLIDKPNTMYVGGNPQPIAGTTLIEKAVNASFVAYDQIRTVHNNRNTPYGCDGRILALKKEFYKKVVVPEDMIANDNFMYFVCNKLGYDFEHVRDAIVYFRSPATLRDHLRQNKRFIAARKRMLRIFTPQTVAAAYAIPITYKFQYIFPQLIKHPILALTIFIVNLYCLHRALIEEKLMTAKWAIAETTKYDINR
ncbi:MAG: glycosyltransferase family 2 protein [Weeksellaceae bacterium]